MPPKQKINREVILQAAFELVREHGAENLNARTIAKTLHCSTQPIFSYFENMYDLKADLFNLVNDHHSQYFNKIAPGENLLLDVGLAYVDYALEEPNLFRLLFMSDGFGSKPLDEFVSSDCNENVVNNLPSFIDRNALATNDVFTDMWLYAHGIATMLVMNELDISREEIKAMITRVFQSFINRLDQTGALQK